jgi:hypothetical protein
MGVGKSLQLFADTKKEQTTLRKKWIHRIFKAQDIPLSQMRKIFPERYDLLELYDKMYKNRDEEFV